MMNRQRKIILVEDNIADVSLVKFALSSVEDGSTYEVVHYADGEEFVHSLNQSDTESLKEISLILMDLNMPKMGGLDVLKAFKDTGYILEKPVVIFSSSVLDQDINECYELGANAYVNKPTSMEEYETKVQTIADFWCGVNLRPNFGAAA